MPAPIAPLRIAAYTVTSAAGVGKAALLGALGSGRSALTRNDFGPAPLPTWIGRVGGLEGAPLPKPLAAWECRNNRLAWLGLNGDAFIDAVHAARERHGTARIAVVLGTSTSSIGATEDAYRHLDGDGAFPADNRNPRVHTPHSLASFVQEALDLAGPSVTVSTACSSSAKVFATAERMIRLGLVDAAVVGGVDTLCGSVLYGFNSLGLVSTQACRPFDAARDGLSLGEAGGFALLERKHAGSTLQLRGYGESSDAHHMSTPHPEGLGARLAMGDALARAGIDAADVGYLNLHGTATPANDAVEARAVAALFPDTLHASSTKGWTGHTLGAAGIVESIFALIALQDGLLPGTLNSRDADPACGPQVRFDNADRVIAHAMNNSFGFGGNNCSLVFGRAA